MEINSILKSEVKSPFSGDADIENRLVDTEGAGEGGMNWESSMETYTLPYVK